jgi:homoserine O-succinyltransferase
MAAGFALAEDALGSSSRHRAAGPRPINIGLVNNMPDAALVATEAQFQSLIARAAAGREVRLRLFSLPGVPRSAAAQAAMRRRYISTDSLPATPVDALTDWAECNTVSTVFSCLAAHAAVLHLDGLVRQPLAEKCSGVYAVDATTHPLAPYRDASILVPHSRLNGLDEKTLDQLGYQVLTRSDEIGVDSFVRDRNSLFLFLQGHPEYAADSLALEYRRDVRRYLLGERPVHPGLPTGYFAPEAERSLAALAVESVRTRDLSTLTECARILRAHPPAAVWGESTERLYRNWLALIAARVGARAVA